MDCPEQINKRFFPYPYCRLNDKICVREIAYPYSCSVYNEYLEEMRKEEEEGVE